MSELLLGLHHGLYRNGFSNWNWATQKMRLVVSRGRRQRF